MINCLDYFISTVRRHIFSQVLTSPRSSYNSQSKARRIKKVLFCLLLLHSTWLKVPEWVGFCLHHSGLGGINEKKGKAFPETTPAPHTNCKFLLFSVLPKHLVTPIFWHFSYSNFNRSVALHHWNKRRGPVLLIWGSLSAILHNVFHLWASIKVF